MAEHNKCVKLFTTIVVGFLIFLSFLFSLINQVICWVCLWPLFLCSRGFRAKTMALTMRIPVIFCLLFALYIIFVVTGLINPFWCMKVIRPWPKGYTPKRTVFMSNHLCQADPFVLVRALFPVHNKAIYKADLRKVPVAGWVLALSDDIPVYFTKDKGGWGTVKGSIGKMMNRALANIELGCFPAVYPEGTRSRTSRLQPFKDGFFRFAIENDCEIMPVAIFGQQFLWGMDSKFCSPGTYHVMYGDPISSEGKNIEELKKETRDQIAGLIKLSPLYNEELHNALPETAALTSRGEHTL